MDILEALYRLKDDVGIDKRLAEQIINQLQLAEISAAIIQENGFLAEALIEAINKGGEGG